MSTMPVQKPGRSVQEVGTPPEFLRAVEKRFGPIVFDLAADESNHVTVVWFGPGGAYPNALAVSWWDVVGEGLLWCNPPYDNIRAFARKARIESEKGARVALLIPASVATNWFAEEIDGHALVLPIRPRLTFVGHTAPYPKDLMLCMFGPGARGFECWRWRP